MTNNVEDILAQVANFYGNFGKGDRRMNVTQAKAAIEVLLAEAHKAPNTDSVDAELREQVHELTAKCKHLYGETHADDMEAAILQLLTQARKEPESLNTDDGQWIDELILDLVHQGSMLPGGKTISASMFPAAKQAILTELAQARKGYVPIGKELELLREVGCTDEAVYENLANWKKNDSITDFMFARAPEHYYKERVVKYPKPKLYTQADVDQAVAEGQYSALAEVKQRLVALDDADATKSIVSSYMAKYRTQSNPHTPPQEQK